VIFLPINYSNILSHPYVQPYLLIYSHTRPYTDIRPYNHQVCLEDGETPTWGPLCSMSRTELVVLKEWLQENMSNGFIRQSSSQFAALVLFVEQTDGGC